MGNYKKQKLKKQMEQIYFGVKEEGFFLKSISETEVRFTPHEHEALLISDRLTLETLIRSQSIVPDTSTWVIVEFVGNRPIGR